MSFFKGAVTWVALVAMSSCGQTQTDVSGLNIVGGEFATVESREVLSTVALTGANGQSFCTGTLIAPRYVITASHCLGRGFNISFGLSMPSRFVARVQNAIPNPDGFDIAVVRLAEDAPEWTVPAKIIDPAIQLESLNVEGQVPLILAGFGQTNLVNGTSGRLKVVTTVLDRVVPDRKEIWFGPTPGESACRGDSGGPAFVDVEGELFLVGATNGGHRPPACSGAGKYADVRAHLDWISAVMGN